MCTVILNTSKTFNRYVNAIYTVMAKNIGTLGKYDQRRLWKWFCIVNPFDILFKQFTKI